MLFTPQPGPQTEVLLRTEYELMYGGAKYGGKTYAGRLFLLKGNPDKPQGYKDANTSYVFNPNYRALVLRRNVTDLEDWISKAREMFCSSAIGAKWVKADRIFQFPHPVSGDVETGARIIVNHLAEEGAYEKYTGREFQRVLIEELSFIPTLELYSGVASCCRTTFRDLRPQIFTTTNPIGVGWPWIKKRFLYDPVTGVRVPPKTRIVETKFDYIQQKNIEVDRVFIPAGVKDNRIGLAEDPDYVARLMTLPDVMRRAYLEGDLDIMAGDSYFNEFRPDHLPGEPDNYIHCVPSTSVPLNPWDQRWAGCDWGFNHPTAMYWLAKHEQDERIYVYRELTTRFVGSYDLGITFARQSLGDLSGMDDPQVMTLWMSPDAFSNRDASHDADSTSIVSRFSAGVRTVLGPQSVYVPDPQELKDAGVEEDRAEDFFARKSISEGANIVIRRAPNQRVAGWSYLRELLSCQDQELGMKSFDRDYAKKLLSEGDGLAKYFRYIEAHRKLATRPSLPRLRIFSDRCPKLIDGIQRATYDDSMLDVRKTNADHQTGEGGDDSIDSLRYSCLGFQKVETVAPPSIQRHRQLQHLRERFGESPLFWQALDQIDKGVGSATGYNKHDQFSTGLSLHRQASHPSRRYAASVRDQKLHRNREEAESRRFLASLTDC